MNSVQQARLKRTKYFFEDRTNFIRDLYAEIRKFVAKCRKLGLKPALRLNGTSDIMWEQVLPQLFVDFPEIQFYDYTKIYKRMVRFLNGELPANYHLTFSLSEINFEQSLDIAKNGGNVAVVFRNKGIPSQWLGIPVHNADETDLRFLDKPGVISSDLKPILERLDCTVESWLDLVRNFRRRFRTEAGRSASLAGVSALRRACRFSHHER